MRSRPRRGDRERVSAWLRIALNDSGPSVSVNQVFGPSDEALGRREPDIEIQSGDHIRIVAKSFDLPTPAGAENTTAHAYAKRD
jgi:hypothetical protein